MNDEPGILRCHAIHCRFLARGSVFARKRTLLFTMAIDLEEQAAAIDALKLVDPE